MRTIFILSALLAGLSVTSAAAAPRVRWSTYYGSGAYYSGQAVALEPDGSIVLAGNDQPECANGCQVHTYGFVLRLNSQGSAVLWRKDLPANVNALAIDRQGDILLTGASTESNFPLVHAFQRTARGEAAVVAKLSPQGKILFSTYLGGGMGTFGKAIAADPAGNIYVAGSTSGQALPTVHAIQPRWGGQSAPNTYGTDAFVAKFTANGRIVYSTYLGRKQNDEADDIAVDAAGNAYVTGWTASAGFPTVAPLPGTSCGRASAFLSQIDPSGSRLVSSTCLSHRGFDFFTYLVRAPDGSIYLASLQRHRVFRLAGRHLQVFAGLPPRFSVQAMASGTGGSLVFTGSIAQADKRTCGQEDSSHTCTDAFVLGIGPTGKSLFRKRLGGKADDSGNAVAALGTGIVVTGMTASKDFPLQAPLQAHNGGLYVQYNSGPVDMFATALIP